MVKPTKTKVSPTSPDTGSIGILLLTLADTTWRMVVPTLALAVLGLWLDFKWHTGPWLTLLGTAVGLAIAGLLVQRQIRSVA